MQHTETARKMVYTVGLISNDTATECYDQTDPRADLYDGIVSLFPFSVSEFPNDAEDFTPHPVVELKVAMQGRYGGQVSAVLYEQHIDAMIDALTAAKEAAQDLCARSIINKL